MPWLNQSCFELTAEEVARTPDDSGIVGLKNRGEWVYIASSNSIRRALKDFLEGSMPWISQQHPVQFSYELVEGRQRAFRCSELTAEYRPVFLNCA